MPSNEYAFTYVLRYTIYIVSISGSQKSWVACSYNQVLAKYRLRVQFKDLFNNIMKENSQIIVYLRTIFRNETILRITSKFVFSWMRLPKILNLKLKHKIFPTQKALKLFYQLWILGFRRTIRYMKRVLLGLIKFWYNQGHKCLCKLWLDVMGKLSIKQCMTFIA